MATGDKYLSISENRLLGWQSLKNLFFDYLDKQSRTMAERVYATGSTFGSETALVADGVDQFKLVGYPTDSVSAVDGLGRFLDFRQRTSDVEDIHFENTLGVVYEVSVQQAPLPGGVFVNPADGMPAWNYFEDIVGFLGTPNLVTDNGNGTLTFEVDSITEAGHDNHGRQVYVYKNTITKGALTDQLARQLCTTVYTGGKNKITTTLVGAGGAGTFGQVVASTTPSHYTVILVGPRVGVGLDLLESTSACFLGTVTGASLGNAPTVFAMADQNVFDFDLTLLSDITRLEPASGTDRLKVDVKVIPGDAATDQIRVTNGALSPTARFKVDGSGNVTIEGNLTVVGTTYQHNIEQYNATTATIDNLTAGNADTDTQAFKGGMTHTHGTGPAVTDFQIDGATGEVGVGAAKETGVNVKLGGRVLHKVGSTPYFEIDSSGLVGIGGVHEDTFALKVTGNMKVSGTIDTGGGTTFGGHIKPALGNTYDLGEETPLFWRSVYATTGQFSNIKSRDHSVDITVFNSLLSNGTSLTLGSGSYYWGGIYATDAYHNSLRPRSGSDITLYGNVLLSAAGWNLGAVGTRFGTASFTTANIGTLQNNGADLVFGDHIVGATSKTCGTAATPWSGIFGDFFSGVNVYTNNLAKKSGSVITVYDSLIPATGGTRTLGNSTTSFSEIWGESLKISPALSDRGGIHVASTFTFMPLVDMVPMTSTVTLACKTGAICNTYLKFAIYCPGLPVTDYYGIPLIAWDSLV